MIFQQKKADQAQFMVFVRLLSLEAAELGSELRASSHRFRLRACSQEAAGETKISMLQFLEPYCV